MLRHTYKLTYPPPPIHSKAQQIPPPFPSIHIYIFVGNPVIFLFFKTKLYIPRQKKFVPMSESEKEVFASFKSILLFYSI